MKYLFPIPVLLILLLIASCSDKYKTIYNSAPISVLYFNNDTIHIREKDSLNIMGWTNPILWIKSTPSLRTMNFIYSETSGKIHFKYRQEPIKDSEPIIVAGDSTSLYCHCDSAGLFPVDFYLLDQLERVSTKRLYVDCIANEKAKTDLAIQFIDSSSTGNWKYRFDASRTAKNYGKIWGWYFSVDNQSFYAPDPTIDWIFHSPGEHLVSLFVRDDLGVHSDTVFQKIFIP